MGAHILFCIKGVFCLENKSISPNLTPYLISGPNVALICLKAEAEGSLCVCKCSPIPWLSSAPVNLCLVLQSRPRPSLPHCMPEPLLWVWLLFIYPGYFQSNSGNWEQQSRPPGHWEWRLSFPSLPVPTPTSPGMTMRKPASRLQPSPKDSHMV